MSINLSVSSKLGSDKVLWSWAVSEKNNKFGSTKTSSTSVGLLVAIHSALAYIPPHLDIIIRTNDKKVIAILENVNKPTKNPLITTIFNLIKTRKGFVRCLFVSPNSMNTEDKRAIKMLQVISSGGKTQSPSRPAQKKPSNSLLRPPGSKTVRATVTKRAKKIEQPLTTGLEDWDDDGPTVVKEYKGKPVLCESCDAPISPLTNECLCSN